MIIVVSYVLIVIVCVTCEIEGHMASQYLNRLYIDRVFFFIFIVCAL